MMCKRLTALLTVLICLAALMPLHACAQTTYMLVLSDEHSSAYSAACMQRIRKLALYSNWNCLFQDASADIDLTDCEGVVICTQNPESLSTSTAEQLLKSDLPLFVIGSGAIGSLAEVETLNGPLVLALSDEASEENQVLIRETGIPVMKGTPESSFGTIYDVSQPHPLCQTIDKITHLACFDPDSDAFFPLLANCLQQWRWPYANTPLGWGAYLVVENIYPFSDPAHLMSVIDMIRQEHVPYSLCVKPVYQNTDYPAFKRLCEVLRYAQSQGAAIILDMPSVSLSTHDTDEIQTHIATAFDAYTRYGVYPLAAQAPETWLTSSSGLNALAGFRTVIASSTDDPIEKASGNMAYQDGHQLIAAANTLGFTNAYPQAICLDANGDVQTLRSQIRRLKQTRHSFKSLRDMENIVYADQHFLYQTPQSGYVFNSREVSTAYVPFDYSEAHDFQSGFSGALTQQLETGNKIIRIFVLTACSFFLIAIVIARLNMRRKLLGASGRKPAIESEVNPPQ